MESNHTTDKMGELKDNIKREIREAEILNKVKNDRKNNNNIEHRE